MTRYELAIFVFLAGCVFGSLATYWIITKDRRTIQRIRSDIVLLGDFNDIPKAHRRSVLESDATKSIVSDEEVLAIYRWVVRLRGDKLSGQHYKSVSPTMLTAEIIICEKMLGLTSKHAIRAMLRIKDLKDLQERLQEVTVQMAHENSN